MRKTTSPPLPSNTAITKQHRLNYRAIQHSQNNIDSHRGAIIMRETEKQNAGCELQSALCCIESDTEDLVCCQILCEEFVDQLTN